MSETLPPDVAAFYLTRTTMALRFAAYRDTDGRPAAAEVNGGDLVSPDDVRTCAYPDSRRGHPMNVGALRQMTAHWKAMQDTVAFVRAHVASHAGHGRLTHLEAYRVAVALVAIPGFVMLRNGASPRDGIVPGALSGVHKAYFDIVTVLETAMRKGLATNDARWMPAAPADANALVELAYERGLFHGPSGHVCAGPRRLVTAAIEAVTTGAADADAQAGATWLGDAEGFRTYADAFLRLEWLRIDWLQRDLAMTLRLHASLVAVAADASDEATTGLVQRAWGLTFTTDTSARLDDETRARLLAALATGWPADAVCTTASAAADGEAAWLAARRAQLEAHGLAPRVVDTVLAVSLESRAFRHGVAAAASRAAERIASVLGHPRLDVAATADTITRYMPQPLLDAVLAPLLERP